MGLVSEEELLTLWHDAQATPNGVPGVDLMRDRVLDVITRALADRGSMEVSEVDAILSAARETGEYRARHGLGDPYAEQRARCIDVWTRLRAELEDRSSLLGPQSETEEASRGLVLGMRIRSARRRIGLTQAQLADKLEVNQTTVARWEAGALTPNHRHRWRLAGILGGRPAHYEE